MCVPDSFPESLDWTLTLNNSAMLYKRILTIQDISCVGKCSMTIALPILAACGHEVSILPTEILSTHTGLSRAPVTHHMDAGLSAIRSHWEELNVSFDIILTGYLGSVRAIEEVMKISETMLAPGGELIVDPAMADHGKLYSGLSEEYAAAMSVLCSKADILLPNITEAAMLSGLPYQEINDKYVKELLSRMPCSRVILTGVGYHPHETGAEIRDGEECFSYRHQRFGKNYHGTGDIFAACFTGARACEKSLWESAKIAADFTGLAIEHTWNRPGNSFGVKFEPCLHSLYEMLNKGPET